ncbi:MAG: mannose-phosphate guanylyltransferase [Candidatus Cloacimonadota bacterium]|jgi:mannose-1-phosphate guanylyltransferase|nr:mannose-phosphate guanylyltransferase [Candidatus Cloacimonadota bacterium]
MIALIMAGGVGSRFWPLSRKSNPKQFLNILSDKPMINMTIDRLEGLVPLEKTFIVTAASQVELIKKHLPELPEKNIIIEPFGMNTAPCIALSSFYLKDIVPQDEVMVVLPADHLIKDEKRFRESLHYGKEAAKQGKLVTFGIKPTYPATGYGYIQAGGWLDEQTQSIQKFTEKPDLSQANEFLVSANYYWNSGMFMWSVETILNSYQKLQPQIYENMQKIEEKWQQKGKNSDISQLYKEMPKIPVDIGIMEKVSNAVVIPVDYGWSDVGSWGALYDLSPKDEHENVIKTEKEVINSSKNYVNTKKTVALIGVENLVVVETDDALLIADKNNTEKVKQIVENLKKKGKTELL